MPRLVFRVLLKTAPLSKLPPSSPPAPRKEGALLPISRGWLHPPPPAVGTGQDRSTPRSLGDPAYIPSFLGIHPPRLQIKTQALRLSFTYRKWKSWVMSWVLAKPVHLYLGDKGYNVEIDWFHENYFFFFLGKGKNATFCDSLLRKWGFLHLCSLSHLSKPLKSLANREVSKERNSD